MSTETKTPTTPVVRSSVTAALTATADSTKVYTGGAGMILLVDNRYNAGDATVTFTTRADPWGRTTDPATYNPVTVTAGTVEAVGPYSARLYGQGSANNDLQFDLSIGATSVSTPTTPAGAQGTAAGGSIADATYYYVCTACDLSEGETVASAMVTVVVSGGGGTASCDLTCDAMTGAAYYKWFRGVSGGPYYLAGATVGPAYNDLDTSVAAASTPPNPATAADSIAHIYTEVLNPTQSS